MSGIERTTKVVAAGHFSGIALAALTVGFGVLALLIRFDIGDPVEVGNSGLLPRMHFAANHLGWLVGAAVVLGVMLVGMGRGLLRLGGGWRAQVLGVWFLVAAGTVVASLWSVLDVVTSQVAGKPSNARLVPIGAIVVGLVVLVLAVRLRPEGHELELLSKGGRPGKSC